MQCRQLYFQNAFATRLLFLTYCSALNRNTQTLPPALHTVPFLKRPVLQIFRPFLALIVRPRNCYSNYIDKRLLLSMRFKLNIDLAVSSYRIHHRCAIGNVCTSEHVRSSLYESPSLACSIWCTAYQVNYRLHCGNDKLFHQSLFESSVPTRANLKSLSIPMLL